jgi:integral membrane protein
MAALVHPFTKIRRRDRGTPAVDTKTAAALHRLRLVSVPEALSFPALLIFGSLLSRISDIDFLMMPLGMIHGVLFVLYVVLLADVWNRAKWPLKRAAFFFVLAVLPFGGLYGDRVLKREEREGAGTASGAEAAGDESVAAQ